MKRREAKRGEKRDAECALLLPVWLKIYLPDSLTASSAAVP